MVAMHSRRVRVILEGLGLLAVLGLAAALRLVHVAENPGWYTDEFTHLDIARHLLAGRTQYMAVQGSWLIFGRLPLFEWLLAGAFRLFGPDVTTLRTLTGLLGTLNVGLVYGIARRASGRAAWGLLAGGLLAVYPQAVLYSRFGFSYNLLAVLVLAAFACLLETLAAEAGRRRRWVIGLGVLAGLGLISDVEMIAFAPLLLAIVAVRRWPDALRAALIMAAPPLITAAGLLLADPAAFRFDLAFTLGRLSGPLAEQGATLLNNLAVLAGDGWFVAGVLGFVGLGLGLAGRGAPVRLGWGGLLLLVGPMLLVGRTQALYSLSAYYTIPLLPLAALGIAGLVGGGAARIMALLHGGRATRIAWALGGLLIVLALGRTALVDWRAVQSGFQTTIDPFLIRPEDARAAAAVINVTVAPDDVVIASPAVAWLVRARVADFQMVTAAAGEAGPHLPADLPPERWAFDPALSRARYVVVDNLWRAWGAVHLPGVRSMLATVEAEWTLVFQAEEIAVYARPGF